MNITSTPSKFVAVDEVGDTLTGVKAGNSAALHTTGAQGAGPLLVLSVEERKAFAQWLLQGTNYEVTPKSEFTKLLDSEELATVQNLPTIASKLNAKTPTHHAQQLADFLNAEHGDKAQYAVSPNARKYARVTQSQNGKHESVHCFVDAEGNVYKSAGWKTPAKGVRTTVAKVTSGETKADWAGSYLYK